MDCCSASSRDPTRHLHLRHRPPICPGVDRVRYGLGQARTRASAADHARVAPALDEVHDCPNCIRSRLAGEISRLRDLRRIRQIFG